MLAAVCLQNVGSFLMYSASNPKSQFQNPNGGTILNSHVCNLKLGNLEGLEFPKLSIISNTID